MKGRRFFRRTGESTANLTQNKVYVLETVHSVRGDNGNTLHNLPKAIVENHFSRSKSHKWEEVTGTQYYDSQRGQTHPDLKRLGPANDRFTRGDIYPYVGEKGGYVDDRGVCFQPNLTYMNHNHPDGYWEEYETPDCWKKKPQHDDHVDTHRKYITNLEAMPKTDRMHLLEGTWNTEDLGPSVKEEYMAMVTHKLMMDIEAGAAMAYGVPASLLKSGIAETPAALKQYLDNQEEKTMNNYSTKTTTYLVNNNQVQADVADYSTEDYLQKIASEEKVMTKLKELQEGAGKSVKGSKAVAAKLKVYQDNIDLLSKLMDESVEDTGE